VKRYIRVYVCMYVSYYLYTSILIYYVICGYVYVHSSACDEKILSSFKLRPESKLEDV
jgi:hypothetical protein